MASKNPQEQSDSGSEVEKQEEGLAAEPKDTVALDEVMSNIGIGAFHYRLLVICGLGFSSIAVEVVLLSFLIPELRTHWSLNEYQIGCLSAAGSGTSILGQLVWGVVADRYGRRIPFIVSVLFVGIFGCLTALSQDYISVVCLRACVGLCLGGSISLDFALYTEFFPVQGRGHWMFLLQTFWPAGQLAACLLAWAVIPQHGWRSFLVVCAIPSFLSAFTRPLVPESPRWLLLQGRQAEAKEVLSQIATMNGHDPVAVGLDAGTNIVLHPATATTSTPLRGTESPSTAESKGIFASVANLFSRHLFRTTVGMIIFSFALHALSYANLTFMPSILERKGVASNDRYWFMVLTTLAEIPAVCLMLFLSTRIGRLVPMKLFLLLGGMCFLSFAAANSTAQIVTWMCLCSVFVEGCWGLMHVYVPEVFPTELRSTACGFMGSMGALTAGAVPFVAAHLLEKFTVNAAYVFFVACAFSGSLAAFLFLHIETFDRRLHDHVEGQVAGSRKKCVF